jgi:hypothetical protein
MDGESYTIRHDRAKYPKASLLTHDPCGVHYLETSSVELWDAYLRVLA